MRELNTRLLKSNYFQILLIVMVAVAAYSNSFNVPFILDDESSIISNEIIHNLNNFFTNRSGYDFLPNRVIGYMTFALNYQIGKLNVVGYHVVNLSIHITNALLIYALIKLTLRTSFFANFNSPDSHTNDNSHNFASQNRNVIPLFTALLFACHPVQTQAVTYIVQRLTSLATLFYLATIVLYICWRTARANGAHFFSLQVFPAFLCSLLTAILAMKTKEIAFTLPFIVLLYEVMFFGHPRLQQLAEIAPLILTVLIIPLTMITLNKPVGNILSDVSKVTVEGTSFSRWEYLCTQFSVIVTYIRLLILPINQNLDYDYPLSDSLLNLRTFMSLSLLLAVFALAVWFWRCSSQKQEHVGKTFGLIPTTPCPELRLAAFGIFWFFVTISVESSIIPIADLIFEHRMYLPSVGFIIAMVTIAAVFARRLKESFPAAEKLLISSLMMATCVLTITTYMRNNVWQSWETMWQDVKVKSPMKPRAYNNLGTYHSRQKKLDEAIKEFEMAVKLEPSYVDALCNLGMLYILTGRDNDAKQIYTTLLKLDPETFRNLSKSLGSK